MILRRLAIAFRKQDWFTVFVEIIIVVLGVFIGLQVQDWSQRQANRQLEVQIVADMLADLEIDRLQYANAMALAVRRIGAVNASLVGAGLPPIEFNYEMPSTSIVSYEFDIPDQTEVTQSGREELWTDVVIGYFPRPSTSTYDAIVGSGDIKIVQDREIVRAIQVYRNLSGSVIDQNEKLVTIRNNVLQTGAGYGLAPYLNADVADYFKLVAEQPELAASIRILATFTIFHHGEIKSADTHAAQLQGRLNAYLEDAQ